MQINSRASYEEFAVLNFIDIKFIVPFNLIVSVFGENFEGIENVIERLVKEGYVKEYEKSYSITELGKGRVKLIRREFVNGLTSEERQLLKNVGSILGDLSYFLQYTITKFQLKADSQKDIINSIEEVHNQVTLALKSLLPLLPHYKMYLDRLKESLAKIKNGDTLFIVNEPNSYYYVFYELHADIKNIVSEIE
jgi:predicted transcriptional regulator